MTSLREMCKAAVRDDAAATKGPWKHETENVLDDVFVYHRALFEGPVLFEAMVHTHVPYLANAAFIANARSREPQLARALLAALGVVEAARAEHTDDPDGDGDSSACPVCVAVRAFDATLKKVEGGGGPDCVECGASDGGHGRDCSMRMMRGDADA